jgi:hypothetical protein
VAVVLDAPVLIGIAMNDPASERAFSKAVERGLCYLTVASSEEFACVVWEHCGSQLAEKWIGWLFSMDNIEIVEASDTQYVKELFVTSVAEAYTLGRVSIPAASAAALSRHMRIPVLTNRPSFSAFEENEFCEVSWAI